MRTSRPLRPVFGMVNPVGSQAAVVAVWLTIAGAGPAAAESTEFFERRIRPLLVEKCQECHGPEVSEAGLRLDSPAALRAGSDGGPVVVPGKPQDSRLLAAVKHAGEVAMPPDEKLSADEIVWLETWIADGAVWEEPEGAALPGSLDRGEQMAARIATARTGHWSFTPPERHEPPAAAAGRIDRFIVAGLADVGLALAPPADPRVLVRRLWFDLTGLPPPADEVDAFATTPTEEAYRQLVERLLASPEHAEHWGRKWLDIARYADTPGYDGADVDRPRYPFAWTYRDWVVGSLAADMPFDRFVILQLAADHGQPGTRGADLAATRADLAALGFLRVGRKMAEHDMIDDAIDVVTRGLMGLTVGCARCHDHKYEPVGIDDYYALHGVFASTLVPDETPEIGPADPGPTGAAFLAKHAELFQAVEDHKRTVRDRVVRDAVAHTADYLLEAAWPAARGDDGRPPRTADGYELQQLLIDRMRRVVEKAGPDNPVLGPWHVCAIAECPADAVPATVENWLAKHPGVAANRIVAEMLATERPQTRADLAMLYGRLVAEVAPEWAGGPPVAADEDRDRRQLRNTLGSEDWPLVPPLDDTLRLGKQTEQGKLNKLKSKLVDHQATAPGGPPRAMVIADRATPIDSHVFLRGDPRRPGPQVVRRMPLVLGGTSLPRDSSGRLELARAIVSPDNPLTPRVIVNWVWTHHVGRGLVNTPGDLGLRGEPPVNCELLDDLARRFVDEGRWSLRWLHSEIVTSAVWRQSSRRRDDLATVDPEDRLFGRSLVRRLDWEPWRDSLLAASGALDLSRRGGPPVELDAAAAAGRRTIGIMVDRQFLPGLMRTFDMTATDICTHVRSRTLVPQQSLAALNAPLVVAAARGLAARAAREAGEGGDGEWTRQLWRSALSRDPASDELAAALAWLETERGRPVGEQGYGSRERLAQAVLATAEFEYVD
ncbi:MAG: PSD1 and planctomycete cytochrome C domain-containing protein [Pirellulales bacterium]